MEIPYAAIKEKIDEWDPIGLLITHAPADEYDGESKKILNGLNDLTVANIEDLSRIIFEVFIKSFGDDVFAFGLDECREIARNILDK